MTDDEELTSLEFVLNEVNTELTRLRDEHQRLRLALKTLPATAGVLGALFSLATKANNGLPSLIAVSIGLGAVVLMAWLSVVALRGEPKESDEAPAGVEGLPPPKQWLHETIEIRGAHYTALTPHVVRLRGRVSTNEVIFALILTYFVVLGLVFGHG